MEKKLEQMDDNGDEFDFDDDDEDIPDIGFNFKEILHAKNYLFDLIQKKMMKRTVKQQLMIYPMSVNYSKVMQLVKVCVEIKIEFLKIYYFRNGVKF